MRMTFQNLGWSVILGLLLGVGAVACSSKDDSSGDDGSGSGSGTTSEDAGDDGGTTPDDGGTGGTGGGSGSDTSDDGGTSGTGGTGGTTGTGTGETTDTGGTASTGGTTETGATTGTGAGTGTAGTGTAGTGTAGTGTGSGTACEGALSGACLGLVGGCASCPEGSLVNGTDGECPESTWCCVPYYPPGNSCHTAGGVCVFNMPQVICPPGWQAAQNLNCGGALSLDCCMPGDSCV